MTTTHHAHLASYLRESVPRFADAPAVIAWDGRALSYAELGDAAGRIACFLQRHGIGPGERVGLLLPKSPESVAVICGTLEAGAAYVPADPTAPLGRSRTIFTDCRARALFLDRQAAAILEGWPRGTRPEVIVVVGDDGETRGTAPDGSAFHGWREVLAAPALSDGAVARSPDHLAYILYTSGSTGTPKGVMLTHGNATSFVDWCSDTFELRAGDRFTSHAPFHFDLSVFDIYACLKHGGTLFLVPDALGKNPRQLGEFSARREITVWYSTPSVLSVLAQFGGLDRQNWPGPRLVLFAGEVFPVRHLRRMTELWPQSQWYNLYGPTETNVCTYARVPTPVPPDRTEPYPIGQPCAHCAALVLDEKGKPVGPTGEGVLHVAGPSVFAGYWNRPEDNSRIFREVDGERYYDTGDVVRRDPRQGLIYVGRRDRMVKRRGFRIELGEIETALYRHPSLREVAAVALPDEDQGVRIVVGLVAAGERPSIIELKSFSNDQLPAYMVPDAFRFFDALPRTSTDKVDYQTLLRALESDPG